METNGRVGWGLCEKGGQGSTCSEDAEKPVKEKHCRRGNSQGKGVRWDGREQGGGEGKMW